MTNLGYATVTIIPSMAGFTGKVNSSLAAAGATSGRAYSKSFGSATAGFIKAFGVTTAAVGVASLLKGAVSLEANYSKTMRQIAVATKAPAGQLKSLDNLAIQLGKDTVFSAGDAADAMLELAKNGLSPATIQAGALKSALTLAAAGGLPLADAATTMSNALNAFGLKGKDANAVASALAGAANASSASVESLAQGLQQAGTVAHDSGLSIQETTAAMAAFANAGIAGSDAGTSLKTFLARLVPTTKSAQKGFDYLHLGFTKANGDFKNLTQISATLSDKFGDMSQAERAVAFNTLFGSDARRAATVLMNEGADGIRKYIAATSDQTQAQKLADASMSGTSGALETLKGSFETFELTVGKALAPAVQTLAAALTDVLNAASGAVGPIGHLVGNFNDLLGPVLGANGALKTMGALLAGYAAYRVGTALLTGFQTLRVNADFASAAVRNLSFSSKSLGNLANSTGAKVASGAAGFLLLSDAANHAGQTLGTFENIAGAAAVGFSVGGPWGAAVGAGVGILKAFGDANGAASDHVKALTDSLDEQTGAVTANTRTIAGQQLIDDGLIDNLSKFGISSKLAVDAMLNVAGAQDQVNAILDKYINTTPGVTAASGDLSAADRNASASALELRDAIGGASHDTALAAGNFTFLKGTVDDVAASLDAVKGVNPAAIVSTQRLGQQLFDTTTSTYDLRTGVENVAAATRDYTDKIDINTKALQKNIAKQQAEAALALQNRHDRYALIAAQDAEIAGLKKINAGLDAHTKVGQANEALIESTVTQWNDSSKAVKNNAAAYKKQRDIFVSMLEQMGKTPAEAKKMANSLLDIPPVLIRAQIDDRHARQQAEDYVKFLKKSLPDKAATAFEAEGIDTTLRQVQKLFDKYHLTPKQEVTELRALGFDQAATKVQRAIDKMRELDGTTAKITVAYSANTNRINKVQGELGLPGLSVGGRIGGVGTGTSDSNLLLGSRGEWMIRQRAAAYYGDTFMRQLNNMQIPRFATGGLVGPTAPQRAPMSSGGVTIHIGQVVAHDYDDFMRQMQRRTRSGSAARG